MKLAYYIKKAALREDSGVKDLLNRLSASGFDTYNVLDAGGVLLPGTDVLLSFGGDGTFLSAASAAAPAGVPVMGVNLGRLGFLSENTPKQVEQALVTGEYRLETRSMLQVSVNGESEITHPLALNEVTVSRAGASMLGVDVSIDGSPLPTYWADGLLVSTSSGSTAYNLSAGGPICMPDARVLIVGPISPHNLNVRPLIVPETSEVVMVPRSRDGRLLLTMDNRNYSIASGSSVKVMLSPVQLKVLCPGQSNFINALRSRLLWGEDVRNGSDNN